MQRLSEVIDMVNGAVEDICVDVMMYGLIDKFSDRLEPHFSADTLECYHCRLSAFLEQHCSDLQYYFNCLIEGLPESVRLIEISD